MVIICAYCGKVIGEKEPYNLNDPTHGMCDDCYVHFKRQVEGIEFNDYLERFAAPVIVVEKNGIVLAANGAAVKRLGMDRASLVGQLCGTAVECAHARLPEGCGQTVHCKTCAIRRAINSTLATGQGCSRVPATLQVGASAPRPTDLLISTELKDNLVVVILEDT